MAKNEPPKTPRQAITQARSALTGFWEHCADMEDTKEGSPKRAKLHGVSPLAYAVAERVIGVVDGTHGLLRDLGSELSGNQRYRKVRQKMGDDILDALLEAEG